MKKRIVGALVLVAIGVLVPLVFAGFLRGNGGTDEQSMRVYEISPDGQARPAQSQPKPGEGNGPADEKTAASADVDASTGAPGGQPKRDERERTPPAISPQHESAADREQAASSPDADRSGEPGETSGAADRASPRAGEQAGDEAPSAAPAGLRRRGPAEGWVVQVASFGDQHNAIELARQLKDEFDAFYRAGEVNGKTYYRVRIGPFDSEAKARATASRLKQRGHSTLVQRAE